MVLKTGMPNRLGGLGHVGGGLLVGVKGNDIHPGIGALAIEEVRLEEIFEDDVGVRAMSEASVNDGNLGALGCGL